MREPQADDGFQDDARIPEPHHVETLTLPFLTLEVFADPALPSGAIPPCIELVRHAWLHFLPVAEHEHLFARLPGLFDPDAPDSKTLELELTWTGNAAIRALNRDYREKDEATDVLSVARGLEAHHETANPGGIDIISVTPWTQLPIVPLGSIFISLEWYDRIRNEESTAAGPDTGGFARYVAERFIHGVLHLLGLHHDTMPEYERVTSIQNRVLQAVFDEEGS